MVMNSRLHNALTKYIYIMYLQKALNNTFKKCISEMHLHKAIICNEFSQIIYTTHVHNAFT